MGSTKSPQTKPEMAAPMAAVSTIRNVRPVVQKVKPILSADNEEARRRVRNLYKAWWRHIPFAIWDYEIPVTEVMGQNALRQQFRKHGDVTDIRVIDMLVIKGQMELVETAKIWKQKSHMMYYFKESHITPKPTDFLSKFMSGHT